MAAMAAGKVPWEGNWPRRLATNLYMAALRTEQEVEEWLASVKCDVIRVDGTKPVAENVKLIIKEMNFSQYFR